MSTETLNVAGIAVSPHHYIDGQRVASEMRFELHSPIDQALLGRISEGSSRLAEKIMDLVGFAPERVARTTLDALDKNQLYVLPQFDARMIWRSKRLAPALYARGAGLINRYAGSSL